jgi:hypothetical protein
MAASITFTLGGNVLTLTSGLKFPIRSPLEAVQTTDRTAAGDLQVESFGFKRQRFELRFRNQPAAEHAALKNWFDTIANGAANAFTYTDPDAADHLVRLLTNPFNFEETASGYTGTLLLEET